MIPRSMLPSPASSLDEYGRDDQADDDEADRLPGSYYRGDDIDQPARQLVQEHAGDDAALQAFFLRGMAAQRAIDAHTPPGASSSPAAPPLTADALLRVARRQLAELEATVEQLAELLHDCTRV